MAVHAASLSESRVARWTRHEVYLLGLASLATLALAGSNAVNYYPGVSIDHLTATSSYAWQYAAQFALPILAICATACYAFATTREAARAALVVVGLGGVLVSVQELGAFLIYAPGRTPGFGQIFGLLGAAGLLCAGLVGSMPATAPPIRAGQRVIRLAAAIGALCLIASTLVPWGSASGRSYALLYNLGSAQRWFALAPVGLALAALAVVVARELDPVFAGAALLASGVLGAVISAQLVASAPFVDTSGFSKGAAGYVGLAGGTVVALAGVWLLASPSRRVGAASGTAVPGALANATATRYLCAAAQLDDRFARESIRRVLDDQHRAVAPSLGIDLGTTLRHCVAARRRHRARDVLVSILVVAIVLLLAYHPTPGAIGYVFVCFAFVLAVVFTDIWTSRYRIAARGLTRDAFDPVAAPRAGAVIERTIAAAVAAERGNVTVYSGFRPFVGMGWDHGGWSFALNVAKGKQQLGNGGRMTPGPVAIGELYDQVRRDVEALALDGVTVEDRAYVDGERIRDDQRFLPDRFGRPRHVLDRGEVAQLIEQPELANRVYRCIRLVGWDGEFVLSIFLNFARTGSSLFAEVRYFLLAPFKEEYLKVDTFDPHPSLGQRARVALTAIPKGGAALIGSPTALVRDATASARRWHSNWAMRRLIRTNPSFDYGATTSVRELAQSRNYRRYFQQLDRDQAAKILERQILDSIVQYLDERAVDTTELEERQAAILNNGVIVSGGTLTAQNMAVGEGARAGVMRATTRAVTAATRRKGGEEI